MKTTQFVLSLLCVSSLTAAADTTYTVRAGDTILKIADRLIKNDDRKNPHRFEMAKQIIAKNPELKDPNVLNIGDSLHLPDVGPAPASEEEAKPVVVASPKMEEVKPAEPAKVEPVAPVAPAPAVVEPVLPSAPTTADVVPPPEEKKEVAEEHEHMHHHGRHNFLVVQPRALFNDYEVKNKSTDEELKLHSKVIAGLNLMWGQALSHRTHLIVKAGANYAELGKFDDEANSLDKRMQWVKNFGLGLEHHVFHSLKVELLALYGDHLFILPTDTNQYRVANVAMPGAELVVDWAFWHGSSYALGLTVAGEYVGNAKKDDVKYESALDPVATLYVQSDRGHEKMNYRLAALYTTSEQSPDEGIKQDVKTWGVNLSLMFPF